MKISLLSPRSPSTEWNVSAESFCWVVVIQHVAEVNKSLHDWSQSNNVSHLVFNPPLVCCLQEIQPLYQNVCVLIFLLSQLHWVKIRLAHFDLGSHSCNLLMPPRSRGMALTDHLTGWKAAFISPISGMNATFSAFSPWPLKCLYPVESTHLCLTIHQADCSYWIMWNPPPFTAANDLSYHLSHTPKNTPWRDLHHCHTLFWVVQVVKGHSLCSPPACMWG